MRQQATYAKVMATLRPDTRVVARKGLPRSIGAVALVSAVGAAVAGTLALSAGGTVTSVSCGDTVSGNVSVTSDLSCTGPGLIVKADNTRINLNGHTISGDGGLGDVGLGDVGIDNSARYDGVTVTNGRLEDFGVGVAFSGSTGGKITKLTIRSMRYSAIFLDGTNGTQVRDNSIFDSRNDGILVVGHTSTGNTVTHNRIVRAEFGILLEGRGNVATQNLIAGTGGDAISDDDVSNVITDNTILHAGGAGIHVGINGGGDDAIVRGNDVEHPGASGILVDRSPGSTVESNRIVGASSNKAVGARGAGIDIRESTGMIVTNNVLIANDDEGLLFSFGRGSVTSNSATGNGGSGIVLCGSAVTFADNEARDNRSYGFVTTPGFTDGGGNQALDNGLEPQWNTDGC